MMAFFFISLVNFSFSQEKSIYTEIQSITFDSLSYSEFKSRFDFKRIFLVYAGPYPSSPTSAFGHIFVLLEDVDSTKSILEWNAINYTIDVQGENGLQIMTKGLFGGYRGNISIQPFHSKIREYTFMESRSLYLFPMKLEEDEKNNFLNIIYSKKYNNSEYKFLNKNCASYLKEIFKETLNHSDTFQSYENATLSPRDLIILLKNQLGKPLVIESVESYINQFDIKPQSIESLTQDDAAILLTILEWSIFNTEKDVDPSTLKILEKLRVIVATSNRLKPNELVKYDKPFRFHPPQKIGIGFQNSDNNTNMIQLRYRLALHEFEDNNDIYPKSDFADLLKFNIALNEDELNINEIWLFEQSSYPSINNIKFYTSSKVAIGSYKEYMLKENSNITGVFIGSGLSYSGLNESVNFSTLFNNNLVYVNHYGSSLLTSLQFESRMIVSSNIKLYYSYEYMIRNIIWKEFYQKQSASLYVELTDDLQFNFQTIFNTNDIFISTGLQFFIE